MGTSERAHSELGFLRETFQVEVDLANNRPQAGLAERKEERATSYLPEMGFVSRGAAYCEEQIAHELCAS
jgi:hypothetical protein